MISDIYLLIAIKQTYSQTLFQYSKSFHLEAENKYKSTHFKLRTKVSELSKVRTKASEIFIHETRNWLFRVQNKNLGREEGGGFRMGNTCIPVADSF